MPHTWMIMLGGIKHWCRSRNIRPSSFSKEVNLASNYILPYTKTQAGRRRCGAGKLRQRLNPQRNYLATFRESQPIPRWGARRDKLTVGVCVACCSWTEASSTGNDASGPQRYARANFKHSSCRSDRFGSVRRRVLFGKGRRKMG